MKKAILTAFAAFTISGLFAQVSLSTTAASICSGSSVNISASGADSYFWSPAEGLNSTNSNSITASPLSSTTYTVTGFDQNGNSSTATVSVTVNENPVLNLSVAQASSCNFIPGLYQDALYPDVKKITDVQYGQNYLPNGQLVNLTLDIYMPLQLVNYKRPAIVVLHGGGFLFGSKDDTTVVNLSNYFAQRGYVVYNANYRTGMNPPNQQNAGKAYYRAVQDAKCCVRYIHKTGIKYGVDTSQIFIAGVSAGAMTSIATAYLDQQDVPSWINYSALGNLENAGGNTGFSSKVKAVVSIAGGVYDTTTIFNNETEAIYSFHGTNDNTIPYYSGLVGGQVLTYGGYSVNEKANQCGVNSTLHTFYGGGHVPADSSPEMDTIKQEAINFLFTQLNHTHGENSIDMVEVTGATQYSWSPSIWLSDATAGNVIAIPLMNKLYTITGINGSGCSAQTTIELKSAVPFSTEIKIDTVQNHLNLYANTIGGQSLYSFLWNNDSTSGILNAVDEGNYSVTVTSGDCNATNSVQIDFPQSTLASNLHADYLFSCSGHLSWQPMQDALYQKIIITNLNDSTVTPVVSLLSPVASNYDLTNLDPLTNYKVELIEYTWNYENAGTALLNIKSKPCEMPISLTETYIGQSDATIQWTSGCTADGYRFKYRKVGDDIWKITVVVDPKIELANLDAGTTYEYSVRTICIDGVSYSKKSDTKTFTTLGLKKDFASLKTKSEMVLFPNPSNGNFTVQASLPESVLTSEIEIINSLGQIVFSKTISTDEGSIDEYIHLPTKLPVGVYEVRIKNGNTYLKRPVIIR